MKKTLPIPYADLVAPLTWGECKTITDACQAEYRARFGDAWQPPSDENLVHWACSEIAEAIIACRNVDPERSPHLMAAYLKELADVMFVAPQIGDRHLRELVLKSAFSCARPIDHDDRADAVVRAAFRLVAHDNLRRLKTATIAPDGKVTKSPDYPTGEVLGWIEEVLRQTE